MSFKVKIYKQVKKINAKMDWDKGSTKNMSPLIQELEDKCKEIHHLKKLLKIKT